MVESWHCTVAQNCEKNPVALLFKNNTQQIGPWDNTNQPKSHPGNNHEHPLISYDFCAQVFSAETRAGIF